MIGIFFKLPPLVGRIDVVGYNKRLVMLAPLIHDPLVRHAEAFFYPNPGPLCIPPARSFDPLLRVVAISIVLVVLGVLYIVVNPHDGGMRGFGWFIVAVGAIISAVFTYIWARKELFAETLPVASNGPRGRKGRSQ